MQSNACKLNAEPRGWRNCSIRLQESTTNMKVLALLDRINRTPLSLRSGITPRKVSRMLSLKLVLANGGVHWLSPAACLALTVKYELFLIVLIVSLIDHRCISWSIIFISWYNGS